MLLIGLTILARLVNLLCNPCPDNGDGGYHIHVNSYDYDQSILLYLPHDVLDKVDRMGSDLFFNFHRISSIKLSSQGEKSNITIDLGINSCEEHFHPNDCTLKTGIIPDEIRYKGDVNRLGRPIPFSEWGIEYQSPSMDFDAAISKILARIEPQIDRLRQYAETNKLLIMLNAYVTLWDDAPGFLHLSSENLKKIVALGCDLGFDFYDYRNHSSDGEIKDAKI